MNQKPQSNSIQNYPPSEREIEKWRGLSPTQKAILRRIARRKGSSGYRTVSKKNLAEEVHVSKPTIDRQVELLVENNLLERKSDGKIKYGPSRKNAYRVVRQIYQEKTYTDENGKNKVRVIQPGLDFKKPIFIGKRSGYLNPPDEEHREPYITPAK